MGFYLFYLMAKRFQSRLGQTFPLSYSSLEEKGPQRYLNALCSQVSRSLLSEGSWVYFCRCYATAAQGQTRLCSNGTYFLVVLDTKPWALHMLGKQSLYHCATFLHDNKTRSEILRCESHVFFKYYKLLASF